MESTKALNEPAIHLEEMVEPPPETLEGVNLAEGTGQRRTPRRKPVASIDHDRELMRSWIARVLIRLVAVVILALVILFVVGGIVTALVPVSALEALAAIILLPLLGLVRIVTRHYFPGAKK